jgi:hypothetical protein
VALNYIYLKLEHFAYLSPSSYYPHCLTLLPLKHCVYYQDKDAKLGRFFFLTLSSFRYSCGILPILHIVAQISIPQRKLSEPPYLKDFLYFLPQIILFLELNAIWNYNFFYFSSYTSSKKNQVLWRQELFPVDHMN